MSDYVPRHAGIKGLLREPLLFSGQGMQKIAVFVDAGYFLVQGGVEIAGEKIARKRVSLDVPETVNEIRRLAAAKAPSCKLLRIYWYDGLIGYGQTAEQASLALSDDVKLRLGRVNEAGEQKEVDSLIVTDLIELARLKSIDEAILISGDADLRIGVQIAQSYGVRVHLVGVGSARGNQSPQLRQEADTTSEWAMTDVRRCIRVEAGLTVAQPLSDAPPSRDDSSASLAATVEAYGAALSVERTRGVLDYWQSGQRGFPRDVDGGLLNACKTALGRELDSDERRTARRLLSENIRSRPGPDGAVEK
jgi:hypothetical protein